MKKNMSCRLLCFFEKSKSLLRRITIEKLIKKSFGRCGKQVRVGTGCTFIGKENILIGEDVSLGANTRFISTRAKIIIGNHVMFAPGVTVVTGNHKIDLVGRYMSSVKDNEKDKTDDKDVWIHNDVWIGTNSTILCGVTIGSGAVIAAGSVITKDVPQYCVVGGNPARIIKERFNKEDLKKHIELINEK